MTLLNDPYGFDVSTAAGSCQLHHLLANQDAKNVPQQYWHGKESRAVILVLMNEKGESLVVPHLSEKVGQIDVNRKRAVIGRLPGIVRASLDHQSHHQVILGRA